MYGSLGDTVVDETGKVAHRHHEEWHDAIAAKEAKNVGQQWHLKAKLQATRKSLDVRVPLVLGPGATIGRDKAVLECRRLQETQHDDGDRAVAAKRQWPHVANTAVRCATPALLLEFSRPQDVVAIGVANELELKEKFTELFRFDGALPLPSHRRKKTKPQPIAQLSTPIDTNSPIRPACMFVCAHQCSMFSDILCRSLACRAPRLRVHHNPRTRKVQRAAVTPQG